MSKPGVEQLAGMVTAVWAAGFGLVSRLRPASLPLWQSGGGQKVLVVAPHPDDEVAGCGGTILRHRQAGDSVTVLVVTDGSLSRAGGLGPEEMAGRRREEAEEAADMLDVELVWAGLPEGDWQAADLGLWRERVVESDIVYAPGTVDFHPEHLQTAHALASLLVDEQMVRIYQVHTPLTAVLANLATPVTNIMEQVNGAAGAYRTQVDIFRQAQRLRRYGGQRYRIPGMVELFWEMAAENFSRLHAEPPAHWSKQPYRGLRTRPWTDPLAYMAGRAERKRLAAAVRLGTKL